MATIISCIVLAGVLVSFIFAALNWRSRPGHALSDRVPRAVTPWVAWVAVVFVISRIFFAPFEASSNDLHLTPTFALTQGHSLYSSHDDGPFFNPMYPPINFLVYLPATMFNRPTPALVTGSLISVVLMLLPVWFMLRRHGDREKPAGLVSTLLPFALFVLLIQFSGPLGFSTYRIRPDAPSIGFALAAVASLYRRDLSRSMLPFVFASLFCALSAWSKQVMFPVAFALIVWVALAYDWRRALRFTLVMTAITAVISVTLVLAFGPLKYMLLEMIEVPSRHPMRQGDARVFYALFMEFARELVVPLTLTIFALALARADSNGASRTKFLRDHPWTMLVFAGVFMLPMTLLQRSKEGGVENAYSFTTAFVLVAAVVGLAAIYVHAAPIIRRSAGIAMGLVGLTLAVFLLPQSVFLARDATDFMDNDSEAVYRFASKYPGQTYFPWHTLPVLLAEGKLYSTWDGVGSLQAAKMAPTRERLLETLPANLKYIAIPRRFGRTPFIVTTMLPEYSVSTTHPDLPGWALWMRPEEPLPATDAGINESP